MSLPRNVAVMDAIVGGYSDRCCDCIDIDHQLLFFYRKVSGASLLVTIKFITF